MKKRRCKARMAVLTVLAALLTGGTAARADNVPYQAYSYTLGGDAIELHAPYRVGDTIVQFGEGKPSAIPRTWSIMTAACMWRIPDITGWWR